MRAQDKVRGGPLGAALDLRSLAMLGVLALVVVGWARMSRAGEAEGHAPATISNCRGCHGIAGYRTAFPGAEVYSVPKLGGQQAAYIVKALQDYKAGVRKHPTMGSIAASLSEQQMADLAAYYARSH